MVFLSLDKDELPSDGQLVYKDGVLFVISTAPVGTNGCATEYDPVLLIKVLDDERFKAADRAPSLFLVCYCGIHERLLS
jgi:hypothetical protein